MGLYDSIDMDTEWDGDYSISDDGDLKDTSDDFLKSIRNELHNICRSELNDWEFSPNFATNTSDFRGEPNNRAVGTAIEERYRSRIVGVGLVQAQDLSVRVVPVGVHQIMVVLRVNATSTPGNGLTPGEPLTITLLYDSLEDSTLFIDESKQEKEYRGT